MPPFGGEKMSVASAEILPLAAAAATSPPEEQRPAITTAMIMMAATPDEEGGEEKSSSSSSGKCPRCACCNGPKKRAKQRDRPRSNSKTKQAMDKPSAMKRHLEEYLRNGLAHYDKARSHRVKAEEVGLGGEEAVVDASAYSQKQRAAQTKTATNGGGEEGAAGRDPAAETRAYAHQPQLYVIRLDSLS